MFEELFICKDCDLPLIIDTEVGFNVCTNCYTLYPLALYDPTEPIRRSPPYKRKWHIMEVLRSFEFYLQCREIELIYNAFLKLDREYTKRFPGKSLINYKFVVKYICENIGLDGISSKIRINCRETTLNRWNNMLNYLELF